MFQLLPVAGDDGVLLPHACLDAHTDGLLAGAKVAEPTDSFLLVQRCSGGLKTPKRMLMMSLVFMNAFHPCLT